MDNNEIILYQPDGSISLEVRVENKTIWLTQKQMAQLYGTAVPAFQNTSRIFLIQENCRILFQKVCPRIEKKFVNFIVL